MKWIQRAVVALETIAALLLAAWRAFPYALAGVNREIALDGCTRILLGWLLILAVSFLFFHIVKRAGLSLKHWAALGACTLVLGGLLAVAGRQSLLPKYDYMTVDVICGERTELAGDGDEVWLISNRSDGVGSDIVDLDIIKRVNMAYSPEAVNYCYRNADGSGAGLLRLLYHDENNGKLTFAKSQWSGIVEIWNHSTGERIRQDLYDADGDVFRVSIPDAPLFPAWKGIALSLLYAVSVAAVFQLVYIAAGLTIRGFQRACREKRRRALLLEHGMPGVAIALVPVTVLLFLYAHNTFYAIFPLLMILCGALLAVGALVYLLADLAGDSPLAGVLTCGMGCIVLFLYGPLDDYLRMGGAGDWVAAHSLGLLTCVWAVAALACIRGLRGKKVPAFTALAFACFVGVMFAYNLGSAVVINRQHTTAELKTVKTDFTVGQDNGTPNIYWLHCDGMLGFSSFEKYFGDSQDGFAQALEDRGFQIDRDAAFEGAHKTVRCLPALLCPGYYDAQRALWAERRKMDSSLSFFDFYKDIPEETVHMEQVYCELFSALQKREYQTVVIRNPTLGSFIMMAGDVRYDEIHESLVRQQSSLPLAEQKEQYTYRLLVADRFVEFVDTFIRPVSRWVDIGGLFDQAMVKEVFSPGNADLLNTNITKMLTHAMENTASPYICFAVYNEAHADFVLDENGHPLTDRNSPLQYRYSQQHKYAQKVLLYAIDTILAADPDAVIVAQADHGLHLETAEALTAAFGDADAPVELWNQTMSAVRIPEQYRNGEESYMQASPLNITRYLVNRFVGPNYEYVTQE